MDRYFYTVAALPALSFEEEPRIGAEDFLQFCEETLEPGDMALLRLVRLRSGEEATGNATADGWSRWERSLRGEIAKARSARRGMDIPSALRMGLESSLVGETARAAMAESSPREAEELLLRALWARLNELEVGHHFNVDKLVIYYLRLQLLELKSVRNKAAGEKNFSLLHKNILESQTL